MTLIAIIMTLLFSPQWPSIWPYPPPLPDFSPARATFIASNRNCQLNFVSCIFSAEYCKLNIFVILTVGLFVVCFFLTSTLSTQIPQGLQDAVNWVITLAAILSLKLKILSLKLKRKILFLKLKMLSLKLKRQYCTWNWKDFTRDLSFEVLCPRNVPT